MMDFNNAEPQREGGVIPDGTIATLHMIVRPGNAGEGGWLKRSKNGDSMAMDAEFVLVDGPFAKRKFWTLFTLDGVTDGQKKAGEISASKLRGILESARGIRPDDESDAAKQARRVQSYGDFDGVRFIGKIAVEKGKEGFKDKNTLDIAITPDRKDWKKVEQVAKSTTAMNGAAPTSAAANAGAVSKPQWAM
jgi:hypothetical protein